METQDAMIGAKAFRRQRQRAARARDTAAASTNEQQHGGGAAGCDDDERIGNDVDCAVHDADGAHDDNDHRTDEVQDDAGDDVEVDVSHDPGRHEVPWG